MTIHRLKKNHGRKLIFIHFDFIIQNLIKFNKIPFLWKTSCTPSVMLDNFNCLNTIHHIV